MLSGLCFISPERAVARTVVSQSKSINRDCTALILEETLVVVLSYFWQAGDDQTAVPITPLSIDTSGYLQYMAGPVDWPAGTAPDQKASP